MDCYSCWQTDRAWDVETYREARAKEKEALLKLSLPERVLEALRFTLRHPWRLFSVLVTRTSVNTLLCTMSDSYFAVVEYD